MTIEVSVTCERKHPTCLHEDHSKVVGKQRITDNSKGRRTEPLHDKHIKVLAGATSSRVFQVTSNICTSSIIPEWVSTTCEPECEVLVYALLDTQSDTTFILEETANALNTRKEAV